MSVEPRAPFGEVGAGEDVIEDRNQLARMRAPVGIGLESRVCGELLVADALGENGPLTLLVEQREQQPTAVAALIVVRGRVAALFPRRPMLEFRIA